MTYSCADFTDTIIDALGIELPEDAWDEPSDQADLCLAEIARLQKLAPRKPRDREDAARQALALLRRARDLYAEIGAVRTLDRLRAVLPSAEGAVRAARYRDMRVVRALASDPVPKKLKAELKAEGGCR